MVTYDNKQSMMDKVDYINQLGLGGAMIWALDFDDFTGKFCNEGRYPLLTTINQVGFFVLAISMGSHIVYWAYIVIIITIKSPILAPTHCNCKFFINLGLTAKT